MLCDTKDERVGWKKISVSKLIAEKIKTKDKLLGKMIIGNMRLFKYAYWLLIALLILISYGVHFIWLF